MRLTFLSLWTVVFGFFGCNTSKTAREGNEEQHYNVLFIAIDDLNDWTGFLGGHPQAKTPNLDRLAAQSVIFERAYCAVPACNPSRAAIMTGRSAASTGVYQNSQYFWDSPVHQKDSTITLPKYFAKHGYHTMAMGKLFHAQAGKFSHQEEWEEFHRPSGISMNNHPNKGDSILVSGMKSIQKRHGNFDWGTLEDVVFEETNDVKIAQFAAHELLKDQDKPFFLAAGLFRPHLPWYLPSGYMEQFPLEEVQLPPIKEDDLSDIPVKGVQISQGISQHGDYIRLKKYGKLKDAVRAYLASIKYADDCLGIILDALEKSPYKDNTIVVLWGDHGWHLGEKLHYRKFALWEEANRVPLLIKVPGITSGGSRSKRTVSLLDLYPTLLEAANLANNDQVEGHSLMPLLKNSSATWSHPAISTMGFGRHTVRTEDYRYITYEDGTEELYDHTKDPQEWTNVVHDPYYSQIKEELKTYLPEVNHPDISKPDMSWEVKE